MKKLAIIVIGLATFLFASEKVNAQNWGFMLPNGAGFRINGKNWGVALPYGGGFGSGGGYYGGYYGGCGGAGGYYASGGPGVFIPERPGQYADKRIAWRDQNGWVRRGPRPLPRGKYGFPNMW